MAAKCRKASVGVPVVFDTHAHVSARQFDKDRRQALERATDLGIAFLEVGFNEDSSRKSLALARQTGGFCAVGIHPHDALADEPLETRWQYIESLVLESPRVKAIGEIGLDYFRNLSPKNAQIEAFIMGLDLARRHKLPAIIHQRDASRDVITVIDKHSRDIPIVFHCFPRELTVPASAWISEGTLVWAAPYYPRNGYLRDMLKFVPPDRLLVETDCPWLPPQSKRGRRNEPAYIIEVIETIAEVLGQTPSEISKLTFDNAVRVFANGEQEW